MKNATAQRAQAVRRLRRFAGRCLVLCGTPAPNSAHDLVEQFNIADDGEALTITVSPSAATSRIPCAQRDVFGGQPIKPTPTCGSCPNAKLTMTLSTSVPTNSPAAFLCVHTISCGSSAREHLLPRASRPQET